MEKFRLRCLGLKISWHFIESCEIVCGFAKTGHLDLHTWSIPPHPPEPLPHPTPTLLFPPISAIAPAHNPPAPTSRPPPLWQQAAWTTRRHATIIRSPLLGLSCDLKYFASGLITPWPCRFSSKQIFHFVVISQTHWLVSQVRLPRWRESLCLLYVQCCHLSGSGFVFAAGMSHHTPPPLGGAGLVGLHNQF